MRSFNLRSKLAKILPSMGMLVAIPVFLVSPQIALAADEGAVYGGGTEKRLSAGIDKLVWNPGKSEWEDDLNADEHRFGPGATVTYKIRYRNTGDVDLSEIEVRDMLPQRLNFVSGGGSFDVDSRVFSVRIESLPADSTWREFTFDVQVDSELDIDGVCVENVASLVLEGEEMDRDSAWVCLSSGEVLAAEELPEAGPGGVLVAGGFLVLILGAVLRFLARPSAL